MALKDILSIRAGQCRFCVTDDTPFLFCGEPTALDSQYCEPHHALCHNGYGRDVGLIESMVYGLDKNVIRKGTDKSVVVPVDEIIRGTE